MDESENKSPFIERLLALVFVVALAGIGVWMSLVYLASRPDHDPSNACIYNLRQIDAAANQFALEHHLTNGDAINFPNDLTPYIKLNKDGKIPPCPSGGIYTLKKVGDIPICSLGTTVTPAHVLQ